MAERMKAVILAAGEGKRMRPLTETRPKVMLPIANKPMLEYLITEGAEAGIEEFIITVGYRGETIRGYFKDGARWGVKIEYVAQMKQFGTANAVEAVRSFVGKRFLLINGDVLVKSSDISAMLSSDGFAMGLIESPSTDGLGTVVLSGGRVSAIHEKVDKPSSNLVNAGIYRLTEEIFDAISRTPKSPRGEYELTGSLQLLVDEGHKIDGDKLGYWLNLSYPWDILEANESINAKLEPQNLGQVEEGAVIKGPVCIGEGTIIRANSYIQGPVIIGDNCKIGPNCYIRPTTAISDNCHIGSSVEVKNSIIMANTNVPHHNYVGDSIIGEGCNLGAGTKIANVRLDRKPIKVGDIDSKRLKLGAIIGDGVQTGINASIDSGSLIGNGTFIGPGALASGIISAGSRIL